MSHRTYAPAVDIYSTTAAYKIFITAPDAQDGISLDYDPNSRIMSISGTLFRPAEFAGLSPQELDNVLVHEERPVGAYERTVKLPGFDEVNYRAIKAVFDKGVLTVTVPKGPPADP
jgi:HSP20 family molecular chaperone IbpA